jgi:hypothetical protein
MVVMAMFTRRIIGFGVERAGCPAAAKIRRVRGESVQAIMRTLCAYKSSEEAIALEAAGHSRE